MVQKKNNENNYFSMMSFIFGIISILVSLMMYISVKISQIGFVIMLMIAPTIGPIILIFMLLSILFGFFSLKSEKKKFSKIGLICGGVSIIIFSGFIYEMVKIMIANNS